MQAAIIPIIFSAVLGLRLARKLVNTFQISMDVVTFWCDSMIALWWIRGRSRKFKPCVTNRIREIQLTTIPMMWKHTPTNINPPDLASKDTTVDVLTSNDLCLNGPSFFRKPMNEWPHMKLRKMYFKQNQLQSNPVLDPNKFDEAHKALVLFIVYWFLKKTLPSNVKTDIVYTGTPP